MSNCSNISQKFSNDILTKFINTPNKVVENSIKTDVTRTFIIEKERNKTTYKISNFLDKKKNRQKLYNILKAHSTFDMELSYCQGINYIVANLIYNIESENICFWIFYQIMNQYNWRSLFINNSKLLIDKLDKFTILLEDKIPILYNFFIEIDV